MNYFVFYILGFDTLWTGLKLFDDEVLLIVSLFTGSGFVLAGLFASPVAIQIGIEIALVASMFHICMECIERGDSP